MNKIYLLSFFIVLTTSAKLRTDPTLTPTDIKSDIIKPNVPIVDEKPIMDKKPDIKVDDKPLIDTKPDVKKDDKPLDKPLEKPLDTPKITDNLTDKALNKTLEAAINIISNREAADAIKLDDTKKADDTKKTDAIKKPDDQKKPDDIKKPDDTKIIEDEKKMEKEHEKDPIIKHQKGDLPIPIEVEDEKNFALAPDLDHTPKPLPDIKKDDDTKNTTEQKYYIELSTNNTLVDGLGFHMYKFSNDKKDDSICYGPCRTRWHPVIADDDISDNIKPPLKKEDFSVIKRRDGINQLCFHGIPLYYYEEDNTPKDPPKGMNSDEYGGEFTTVKDTDKN